MAIAERRISFFHILLLENYDVEEYSLTNNCEKLDMDALRAEYERLDRILLEVIADMAVLKYHIDYIGKEND